MSIASQISRLTSIRNSIKAKLVSLGLLQESGGGPTPSTKSGTSQNSGVVTGDDLDACRQAIENINETTPYLLSSTGAKNVAGYKYAQVDTTVFEPIGSSGSINPNAQNAYIGASGGISTSAPSGSVPVSLGQISPSGNYQGMSAVNLLYDSNVIKAENIKNGVSILGVTGNLTPTYGNISYTSQNEEYDGTTDGTYQLTFELPSSAYGKTCLAFYISANSSSTGAVLIPRFTISSITYNSNSGATFDAVYISSQPTITANGIFGAKQNSNPSTVYNSNNKTWFSIDVNSGVSSWIAAKNIKYELVYIYY